MGKRVIFTGGSGKAGNCVIKYLIQQEHHILNLDLSSLDNESVHTIHCDITDAGQVYNAFCTQFPLTEPLEPGIPTCPDAIIHFVGWSRPLLAPDNEVFCGNVRGFHNVLEAACKLGVKKIILASSVTTYGVSYAQGKRSFPSFPINEDLDVNPTDPYALSKVVGETMARSFATRFNIDIYCLRIGRIVCPDEYDDVFESYVYEADSWDVHGWSYVDARDLGQMCHKGLEVTGLGWQVFNATNSTITNLNETTDFLKRVCPDVPFTRAMSQFEAPISNKKMCQLLGFAEEHTWRQYFSRWRGHGGVVIEATAESFGSHK
ncbi:hypothetical protein BKA66DRAFT_513069 [Pyrenochaeta sp. MPI-SDFR-AT-0127]|nr:hypothetical protein BKA66DRAFT_513069 [Pyrenochaeta sp. MPI-SDFR-AT-0127]